MHYRYLVLLLVFSFSAVTSDSTLLTYSTHERSQRTQRDTINNRSPKKQHHQQQEQQTTATQSPEEKMLLQVVSDKENIDEISLENTSPQSSGGCTKCVAREEVKNYSLQNIKQEILTKLGFTHPPNVTGRNLSIKASIYDLITKQRGSPYDHMYPTFTQHGGMQNDYPATASSVLFSEEEEYHFMTDRVLTLSQPHPRLRHHPRGPHVLQFKFSPKTIENKVQGALLWVFLKSTGTIQNVPVIIEVRKVTRPLSSNSDKPHSTLICSQKVMRKNGTDGAWVQIDVKRLVSEWFKSPKDNHGIVIETNPPSEQSSIITLAANTEDEVWVPFLVVHTKDMRKRRTRRTIGLTCNDDSNETRCCRYPLRVDFEEFGWDWIIAPKFYEANYCSGECQFMFLPRYPHTQLVHFSNTSVAGPCCAPRKMSHISMLYFDNDLNIIFGYLPNMVVDRCGCA